MFVFPSFREKDNIQLCTLEGEWGLVRFDSENDIKKNILKKLQSSWSSEVTVILSDITQEDKM